MERHCGVRWDLPGHPVHLLVRYRIEGGWMEFATLVDVEEMARKVENALE